MSKTAKLALFAVAFVALIGVGAFATNLYLERNEPPAHGNAGSAYEECQVQVGYRLVSPGSAIFPKRSEATISHVDDTWTVEAYVDSQNKFGALLRSPISCTLGYAGGGYDPIAINIGEAS